MTQGKSDQSTVHILTNTEEITGAVLEKVLTQFAPVDVPGVKMYGITFQNGSAPKVMAHGNFTIEEWLLIGQQLLEQADDPQYRDLLGSIQREQVYNQQRGQTQTQPPPGGRNRPSATERERA